MTRKEKAITLASFIIGAFVGGLAVHWLIDFTLSRSIIFGIILFALMLISWPVLTIVVEIRKEERANANRSYPANWGYDRSLEN